MNKPVVFIASSSESLSTAEDLQKQLLPCVDSVIWSQDFFKPGSETLRSLVDKAMLYDAGIILFTKDDLLETRGELLDVARDNAIFEAGLLMGRLSKDRAFIVLEKGVNVPSDLHGITSVPLDRKAVVGAYNHMSKVAKSIKDVVIAQHAKSYLGMLPSAALALGYYKNFVKLVVSRMNNKNKVVYPDGSCATPVALKILVPSAIDDDMQSEIRFICEEMGLTKSQLTRDDSRDLSIFCRKVKGANDVEICDIPSTLSVLISLARLVFNGAAIGDSKETTVAVERELVNFVRALEIMIQNDPSARRFVSVERLDSV